jgi:hypothetical protein
MNWGARITVSFIVFAMVIFTMVFISMNQNINLVSEDYYKQEIAYEDQIQRLRNTESLEQSPEITIDRDAQLVIISFPEELIDQIKDGNILLFRPSDSRLDKRYELAINEEGIQKVSIRGQIKGLWKAKLYWQDYNLEYYQEKILNY